MTYECPHCQGDLSDFVCPSCAKKDARIAGLETKISTITGRALEALREAPDSSLLDAPSDSERIAKLEAILAAYVEASTEYMGRCYVSQGHPHWTPAMDEFQILLRKAIDGNRNTS